MKFEIWASPDGLWHWQRVDDSGHVASPRVSYRRRYDCNNALAKQREFYPDAEIVRVDEPTKG